MHAGIYPIHTVQVAIIPGSRVIRLVHVVGHGAIRVELPGGLTMKSLLLLTVGTTRARGGWIVVHFVGVWMAVHVEDAGLNRGVLSAANESSRQPV